MKHIISPDDFAFQSRFESGDVPPAEFDHRAHVRLAWIYLARYEPDAGHRRMREALLAFLSRNGIGEGKYHETLTRGWLLAVKHFMDRTGGVASAEAFLQANPRLLDRDILLGHYSRERLFSDEARAAFVEPDLEPIPVVA
jgi:hypothetical protein